MKTLAIESCIFAQSDPSILYLTGWYFNPKGSRPMLQAFSNGEKLPLEVEFYKRMDVKETFKDLPVDSNCGFKMKIELGKPGMIELKDQDQTILKLGKRRLQSIAQKNPIVTAFVLSVNSGSFSVDGWAAALPDHPVSISIVNEAGGEVEAKLHKCRHSIKTDYFLDHTESLGFYISCKVSLDEEKLFLRFKYKESIMLIPLLPSQSEKDRIRINSLMLASQKKAIKRLNGPRAWKNILSNRNTYQVLNDNTNVLWFLENQLDEKELRIQKNTKFDYQPKFSVLIPAWNTDLKYFEKLLESIYGQSYDNFEICIADASDNDQLENWIKEHPNPKLKYTRIENRSIAENTNEAAEMAQGEYLVFVDHDDLLSENAFYEAAKALQKQKYKWIYSDEDKVETIHDESNRKEKEQDRYSELFFKPDFNYDYLLSCNYINHLSIIDKELFKELGGLNPAYNGAQDYDLVLRAFEKAGEKAFCHIPKILYHWRKTADSTAEDPESKRWAFEAGKKALQDHLKRQEIDALVEDGILPGRYKITYHLPNEPKVSVLIPNKDHIEDLEKCLKSLKEKCTWKNYEILVIENNSEKPETFEYYKNLPERYSNTEVLYWPDEFNYSAINNFGAEHASGEYLLLLNNDTEVIDGDFMQKMLANAARKDAGAVGIKLLYENGIIQHCGVLMGINGPYHDFQYQEDDHNSPRLWKDLQHNLCAVTAAALMVKKDRFFEVEGLDEVLKVAYNDVDFCLRLKQAGYKNIMLPDVRMHHLESISRGSDLAPARKKAFEKERYYLYSRWKDYFLNGDPNYNPNYSLTRGFYTLRLKSEEPERKRALKEVLDGFEDTSWLDDSDES